MASIKAILVRASETQVAAIPIPDWYLDLEMEVDAETALEAVRRHFFRCWGAKVHALQWVFPEDIAPYQLSDKPPYLVLAVDDLGGIPLYPIQNQTPPEDLAPFLSAAAKPCCCEPWTLPNWFHYLSSWIEAHIPATREISQIRTCPNGAVVRIDCAEEAYYLKTQSSALAYESALLRILNKRMPGTCPQLLPIAPDRNSHITRAVESFAVDSNLAPDEWALALREVAIFQVESIDFVPELSKAGIPYRDHAILETQLDEILTYAIALQSGVPNELNSDELRRLLALKTCAGPDFRVLNKCNLPATLIHGDLNESNALKTKYGRTVLIDWALSRITHPFFTLGSALFDFKRRRNLPAYEAWRDAYLEPWCVFHSLEDLRGAFDAASRLFWIDSIAAISSLCQLRHMRNIMNVPRFLRAAIRAYELSQQRQLRE